ncbi:MAG: Ni-sirohydrochlorin a,c-diamide synthase, partial [Candidatus Thermoplasmatota archaeon]|nr:Ni-sirohydrochlorin a,c-diamide synthase [Candidatus Thermoplasmatota archaeon]
IVYGHEFHYSTIDDDYQKSFITINGHGINGMDGITANKTIGSYSHIDLERYGRRIKDFVKG